MVAVLIPWRGGCPHRTAALAWVGLRYPWPVVLGSAEGPWCKAAAITDALARTEATVLVVADGDVWCDETKASVEAVQNGAPWAIPHRCTRRLTPEATEAVLTGGELGGELEEPVARAHPGGGIVVLHRDTWDACPMDARFVGWGHEDDSWGWALTSLFGPPHKGNGTLWHLWHPPQERTSRRRGSEESHALQERYWRAQRDPALVRALIEEGRVNADSRTV